MATSWNLEFVAVDDELPMLDEGQAVLVGAVVLRAGVVDSPLGKYPALIFGFKDGGGKEVNPIVLVMDSSAMAKVPRLVSKAVMQALKKSEKE